MIRAIAFDLDNSLIDFLSFKKATARAAAQAMVKHGLKADPKTLYRQIFRVYDSKGIEYQKTFSSVLLKYKLNKNDFERVQQAAITAYLKTKFSALKAYPEVRPTLLKLKKTGILIGIVSDAPRNKAWQRLVLTGLDDLFDVVVTYNDTRKFKPDPAPFHLFLKQANTMLKKQGKKPLKPEDVLFVGDNPERDIKGANVAGFQTALAGYGWVLGKNSEEKPDYYLKNFTDLEKCVKRG